jgi:hypothetical protein
VTSTRASPLEKVCRVLRRPQYCRGATVYYLIADGMVDATSHPRPDRGRARRDRGCRAGLAGPRGPAPHLRAQAPPGGHVQVCRSATPSPWPARRPYERTALYLRDVYDHLVRINESIEPTATAGNALDAYPSAVGQRTNDHEAPTIRAPCSRPGSWWGSSARISTISRSQRLDPLRPPDVDDHRLALPSGMLVWFRHGAGQTRRAPAVTSSRRR